MDILSQSNFLDIIIIILIFRICYIAARLGLAVEIFKFLGVLTATCIGLHFYTNVSDSLKIPLPKGMPLEFADFLVFGLLVIGIYFVFILFRSIFCHFVKMETMPEVDKFGGFLLGLLRSLLVVGLLSYSLSISTIGYLTNSVKRSYLGKRAFYISPNTYGWFWNNLFSKFSAKGKFNPTVEEVKERFSRQ